MLNVKWHRLNPALGQPPRSPPGATCAALCAERCWGREKNNTVYYSKPYRASVCFDTIEFSLKKKNGEVARYHVLNSAESLKYQAAFSIIDSETKKKLKGLF